MGTPLSVPIVITGYYVFLMVAGDEKPVCLMWRVRERGRV